MKRCGGGSNDSWPDNKYKYNHNHKCNYKYNHKHNHTYKYNHKYKYKRNCNGKGVVREAMIAGLAGLIPGPSGFLLQ